MAIRAVFSLSQAAKLSFVDNRVIRRWNTYDVYFSKDEYYLKLDG